MTPMRAIVYVSSAAQPMESAELERLLDGARRRNAAIGVTGLLLYADGSFMQYLEGPEAKVRALYARITADPLHSLINELSDEPITTREFENWSMAYSTVTLPEFLRLRDAGWSASALGPGRTMLRQVWVERAD